MISTFRSVTSTLAILFALIQQPVLSQEAPPTEATGSKVDAAIEKWFQRERQESEDRFLRALEGAAPKPVPLPTLELEPSNLAAAAGDVFDNFAVIGPAEPIKTPQQVTLKVVGLADSELPQASITVEPKLEYATYKTWAGEPVILVQVTSAAKSGRYTVTVSLNAWRLKVDDGLVAARQAQVPQDLLDEYFALATKLKEKYPSKAAVCAIEVALGPFQPPVVDPSDPSQPPVDPNNPTKVTQLTFVFEKDQGNTPRQVALALNKINANGSGVLASEFEEDSVDGDGEVPDQYKVALAKAREVGLPALVVQSGDVVLRVIKNPRTEAEVMQAIAP